MIYHLNLIPCHYWSCQRNIYFLVNIFVWHTFSMSKSSIKTKTVLTMTDTTESTELLAFKRQKDGYKVTVKMSLCICVVLSWDELKLRQNLLASDYEIIGLEGDSNSWAVFKDYLVVNVVREKTFSSAGGVKSYFYLMVSNLI